MDSVRNWNKNWNLISFTGKLASMKHLKEEVATVKRDMECGLRFDDPAFEVLLAFHHPSPTKIINAKLYLTTGLTA